MAMDYEKLAAAAPFAGAAGLLVAPVLCCAAGHAAAQDLPSTPRTPSSCPSSPSASSSPYSSIPTQVHSVGIFFQHSRDCNPSLALQTLDSLYSGHVACAAAPMGVPSPCLPHHRRQELVPRVRRTLRSQANITQNPCYSTPVITLTACPRAIICIIVRISRIHPRLQVELERAARPVRRPACPCKPSLQPSTNPLSPPACLTPFACWSRRSAQLARSAPPPASTSRTSAALLRRAAAVALLFLTLEVRYDPDIDGAVPPRAAAKARKQEAEAEAEAEAGGGAGAVAAKDVGAMYLVMRERVAKMEARVDERLDQVHGRRRGASCTRHADELQVEAMLSSTLLPLAKSLDQLVQQSVDQVCG